MGVKSFLDNLFGPIPIPHESLQVRDLNPNIWYPTLTEQAAAAFGMSNSPYRIPTVAQALSAPAIYRAVSLISNTTGSLAMEAYRNGVLLTGESVPRLVTRPDPFRTAQKFYRDTTFWMATYGEAWWWIAKRDADGLPASLIVIPPWEITVDDTDRLHPKITWTINGAQTEMDGRDMRQITLGLNPGGGPRGAGPLQLCQAATSVSVESQDWAANFYASGGYPSLVIKAAGSLGDSVDGGDSEAKQIKDQVRNRDHNTPLVVDEGIESVEEFGVNPSGAQMLDARQQNKGDAANMFGIPGVLLEYSPEGSSLTYQNVPEVWRNFVKTCLLPNYLEPVQQEMSDLLPRSTTSIFNLDTFERADPKARWETYNLMVPVLGADEAARVARVSEGLEPGDVEFMPVPFAPPAAFPTQFPVARSEDTTFRCTGRKVVGGVLRPCNRIIPAGVQWTCNRCGETYSAA